MQIFTIAESVVGFGLILIVAIGAMFIGRKEIRALNRTRA